jgi:hypothetical protein
VIAVAAVMLLASCGGGGESQDADEPAGEYPVDVTAKFPPKQRLAKSSDLELEVENIGEETIPDVAVTIFVDDGAAEPFSIRSEQPGLANPNRPVWILEHGYPKLLTPTTTVKDLDEAPTAGSEAAQTNTFSFGSLAPGDSVRPVWRVTPTMGGTYTVNYEIAAGLDGKAKAVTPDGGEVEGDFVVTIEREPPDVTVDAQGNIVPAD